MGGSVINLRCTILWFQWHCVQNVQLIYWIQYMAWRTLNLSVISMGVRYLYQSTARNLLLDLTASFAKHDEFLWCADDNIKACSPDLEVRISKLNSSCILHPVHASDVQEVCPILRDISESMISISLVVTFMFVHGDMTTPRLIWKLCQSSIPSPDSFESTNCSARSIQIITRWPSQEWWGLVKFLSMIHRDSTYDHQYDIH